MQLSHGEAKRRLTRAVHSAELHTLLPLVHFGLQTLDHHIVRTRLCPQTALLANLGPCLSRMNAPIQLTLLLCCNPFHSPTRPLIHSPNHPLTHSPTHLLAPRLKSSRGSLGVCRGGLCLGLPLSWCGSRERQVGNLHHLHRLLPTHLSLLPV
jgi:hypothetical protein